MPLYHAGQRTIGKTQARVHPPYAGHFMIQKGKQGALPQWAAMSAARERRRALASRPSASVGDAIAQSGGCGVDGH
jgi:hypothetical protein